MRRPALLAGLALAAVLSASPLAARADDQKARAFFEVGAKAYGAGRFEAAIIAFEKAYKESPRSGILFSTAQAYRKLYFAEGRPSDLREAIRLYEEYLAKNPTGSRRGDANEALAELGRIARDLEAKNAMPAAEAPVKPKTKLVVSAAAEGARVSVDGKPAVPSPFAAPVEPGKHVVVVSAPGFLDERREVVALEAETSGYDIPLREKPARLVVRGADGAQVSVDGRFVGLAPFVTPVEVPPGRHLVTIGKNGRLPYAAEIELGRGEARTLRPELPTTKQRVLSYGLIGVGSAALVTGGVFLGVAFAAQGDAQALEERRTSQGGLSPAELDAYDGSRARRDDFRLAGGATLAAGVLAGGLGLVLYAFDAPDFSGSGARLERERPKPAPVDQPASPALEMTGSPLVGPGLLGGAVRGSF